MKASAQGLKKSDFPKPQTDDRAKSLAKIERRLDAAIDAMLDGSSLSLRDRLKAKVHDLEAERQTIVDAMNITAADTIRTDRRSDDLQKLRESVSDIDRAWEAATMEERKAMLRLAIDRVRVIGTGRGKTIAIDWASGSSWPSSSSAIRRASVNRRSARGRHQVFPHRCSIGL